jgi:redox-sensitive bicupin YhaK (pirin superfamily)
MESSGDTTMLQIRPATGRGHAEHGWLDSWHSFSFADYYDPARMGIGPLRVLNDDRIAPGSGFGTHPHRDMEIISYVLHGALAHRDSMGNGSVIVPGDVQRMSAGSGVLHSEHNAAERDTTHFLQIWITPRRRGQMPGYEQKRFEPAEKRGQLRLVASPDGASGSVTIDQDARLFAGLFSGAERAEIEVAAGRQAYVHLAQGKLRLNGAALAAGDAAHVETPGALRFDAGEDAEVLVFDLPA